MSHLYKLWYGPSVQICLMKVHASLFVGQIKKFFIYDINSVVFSLQVLIE